MTKNTLRKDILSPNQKKNKKIKECRDCGELVSVKAKTCPHCGTPKPIKNNDNLATGIAWVIIIFVALVYYSKDQVDKVPEKPKTQTEIMEDKIKDNFSYDGSHIFLRAFVVENLKDPNSFEHIKTGYVKRFDDKGKFNSTLTINMSYRARNAFGGYVTDYISADYDLNGTLIKFNTKL